MSYNFLFRLLNRLIETTHPQLSNPTGNFTYDPVGNRTSSHLATGQVHDASNRLLEDSNFTYTYDENGNLTRKTSKATNEVTTYTYDAENQLMRVDKPALVAEYRYDALGRRIEKNVNGVSTRFVYDNEDLVAEVDGTSAIRASYIHGPGIDEPLLVGRFGVGGGTFIYHADGLGSISTLTDLNGNPVRSYTYDSFGRIVAQTGAVINPYTYTGRELDPESGLYHYRARYYDPSIGRFLQVDPVLRMKDFPVEISSNLRILPPYTYAENNPINALDPLGLWTFSIGISLGASAFGAGGGGGTFINIGHNPNAGWGSGWSFSITGTAEAGALAGLGFSPGITFSVTNACNVQQLLGTFVGAGRTGLGRAGIGYFQSPDGVVKGGSFSVAVDARGYTGAGLGVSTTSAIVQWVQAEGFSFGVAPEGALFP